MITLNLLKLLELNGLGKIDENLFWQKMADSVGVYVVDLGGGSHQRERPSQRFTLYSIGATDTEGYKKLEAIVKFLNGCYKRTFELPEVDGVAEKVRNITIMPMTAISNEGKNARGRVVFSTEGLIYY